MLRHSRDFTRHQRERKIRSRKKKLWWFKKVYNEAQQNPDPTRFGGMFIHDGYLNKLAIHHHSCTMCTERYKRPSPSTWRDYL